MNSSLNKNRPDIFEFHDYRAFLKVWLDFLKKSKKGFSVRKLAKSSNIAVGYLSMVIKGERNLTEKAFKKISKNLGLSQSELSFFENLMVIAESSDPDERLKALKSCQRFKDYKTKAKKEINTFEYLSRWYYVAIREMVSLDEFRVDPKWIQGRLFGKVSLAQVKEAWEFLLKSNLVEIDSSGKAFVTDKQLDCTEEIYKLVLSEFHQQVMDLAIKSIDLVPREKRNVLGYTTAISRDKFVKMSQFLTEKLDELENESKIDDKRSEVYHFGLFAVPLTKQEGEE